MPLEVPQVQTAEIINQVSTPAIQIIGKPVHRFEMQCVEKIVEVPQTLIHEIAVEIPQVQDVVTIRQEAQTVIKEVTKQVPKVVMQYVEKVVDIEHNVHEEMVQTDMQVLALA